jgi:hypothetical protein
MFVSYGEADSADARRSYELTDIVPLQRAAALPYVQS